ncbi:hypothetical protein BD310DRAFT_784131, partial [Dichomitus squalens]
ARGYLGHPDANILKATVASLRERRASTSFTLLKGCKDNPEIESAFHSSKDGAKKDVPDEVPLEVAPTWRISGTMISCMTQGFAYRTIRDLKARKIQPRPKTKIDLDNIIDDVTEAYGTRVSAGDIWKSIRSKHITSTCSQFLWKAIHDLFMIGDHWLRDSMPEEYQDRSICAVCGNIESMDHILFRCEAVGQAEVWRELKSM